MLYKLVQIVAYAYDIVVIGRSSTSMKEAFQLLEEGSKEERLVVN
jgi:precorrin isomerase